MVLRSAGSLEIASWNRYCAAAADSGIALDQPRSDRSTFAALAARSDPMVSLGLSEVFGDFRGSEALAEAFAGQLETLRSRVRAKPCTGTSTA